MRSPVSRGGHRPTVPSAPVRIRASEAAAGIGGRLIGPDVEFDGASFDSRTTALGQLFVPIVAERERTRVHRRRPRSRRGRPSDQRARPVPARRHRDRGGRHRAGTARAGRVGPPTSRCAGRGRHRQRRQDVGQGPDGGGMRRWSAHHGQRAQLQQRTGPAGHDPQRAGRHRGADPRDGHARVRPHQPAVRDRPARHRRGHRGRSRTHRARRRDRRCRTGQGRTGRGAAGIGHGGAERRRRTGRRDAISNPGPWSRTAQRATCASAMWSSTPSHAPASGSTRRGGAVRHGWRCRASTW
jgi:hypothetical protein